MCLKKSLKLKKINYPVLVHFGTLSMMSFCDRDRRSFDLTNCYHTPDEYVMESQWYSSDTQDKIGLMNSINRIIYTSIKNCVGKYRDLYPELSDEEIINKVYTDKKIDMKYIAKLRPNQKKQIIKSEDSDRFAYVHCV